jgi:kynurenine 3-monooxygenase
MALENYIEMRDSVLDPDFVRRKAIALQLERRWPDRFIPRYQMVMFHPGIGYAEALRRGNVQETILQALDTRMGTDGEPDLALAERLILAQLTPIAR